jgi:hypothetical protein
MGEGVVRLLCTFPSFHIWRYIMLFMYVEDGDLENNDLNWVKDGDKHWLVEVTEADFDHYMLHHNPSILYSFNGTPQPEPETDIHLDIVVEQEEKPPTIH